MSIQNVTSLFICNCNAFLPTHNHVLITEHLVDDIHTVIPVRACVRASVCLCVSAGRCSLLPVVNNSGAICNSWKLDPTTLRFPLKGMLPFDKVAFGPVHVMMVCVCSDLAS